MNKAFLKEIEKTIKKLKLNSLEEKIYRLGINHGLEIAKKIYRGE
jgi:hypothetical protein